MNGIVPDKPSSSSSLFVDNACACECDKNLPAEGPEFEVKLPLADQERQWAKGHCSAESFAAEVVWTVSEFAWGDRIQASQQSEMACGSVEERH